MIVMALDSAATFTARVRELGLEAHLPRFAKAKPPFIAFAKFAFATKYTPGGDEAVFEKDILLQGLGDVAHDDKAEMRRLFYESYTLAADQLKRILAPEDIPRAVPVPEKLARRKKAAQQLMGLQLKGELDISDRLLERAIDIYDSNTLSYIGLELCTKRSFDLLGGQKDKRWEQIPNAAGVLQMRLAEDSSRASVDTQFAFSFAMQRRSLALLMGDVMAFELSERLRTKYIAVLMKPPQDGYGQVSMQQIITADGIFWMEMMESTALEEGTKRNAHGRPCDLAFPTVFDGSEFRMAIAPRQTSSNRQVQTPRPFPAQGPAAPKAPGAPGMTKAQKRQAKRDRQAAFPPGPPPPAAPNRLQAPAKVPKTGSPMPKALIGMCQVSSAATGSQRFCYAYNLGSCKSAAPGQACVRGLHGCMKPKQNGEACSAPHACASCNL